MVRDESGGAWRSAAVRAAGWMGGSSWASEKRERVGACEEEVQAERKGGRLSSTVCRWLAHGECLAACCA